MQEKERESGMQEKEREREKGMQERREKEEGERDVWMYG